MSPQIHQVDGDLHVELVKPWARFGYAIQIYKRSGDKIWHARFNEDGDLVFTEVEPNVHPDKPTMYLDDFTVDKLRESLNQTPLHTQGERIVNHLEDVKNVRDRMITLVETVINKKI